MYQIRFLRWEERLRGESGSALRAGASPVSPVSEGAVSEVAIWAADPLSGPRPGAGDPVGAAGGFPGSWAGTGGKAEADSSEDDQWMVLRLRSFASAKSFCIGFAAISSFK